MAQAVLEQPGIVHIVVVDDHSPDGTGATAEKLKHKLGRLKVLHRPAKLGLGSAYVAGLQQALALEAECTITMDADFSHQPHHIPQLLEASSDHDLVIGSRYIPGGGVGNWHLHRRILSRGANALARRAAGLSARDCTSGFRCCRAPLLERIDWKALPSSDYAFLIELLFVCQGLGASITVLGKPFTMLPFADVAYRMNLLSACAGAAAIAVTCLLAVRLTGSSLGGLIAALSLAFIPAF